MFRRALTVLLAAMAPLACGDDSDPGPPPTPHCEDPTVLCTWLGQVLPGKASDPTPMEDVRLYFPMDIDFHPDGSILVTDHLSHRIRRLVDGEMETVVGTRKEDDLVFGPGVDSPLDNPTTLAISSTGEVAITAWHNSMVVGWEPDTGQLVPICGSGERSYTGDGGPALDATVDLPAAVEFDEQDRLLIVDQASQRLRRIDHEGVIDSIAGIGVPGYSGDGGTATEAEIHAPVGQTALPAGRLAVAPDGTIYHGDRGNHCVRRIDPDGTIHTVAGTGDSGYSGDGGPATEAELNGPVGLALDAHGRLYIADTDNHCVRRLEPDGTIRSVVGTCTQRGDRGEGGPPGEARLDRPYGVTISPGGHLYVVDTYNHRIRRFLPEDP